MMNTIFNEMESAVQSYACAFPVDFNRDQGSYLYDEEGNAYLDFLAGAGSLNYGHNDPLLKRALLDYIESDGITHGLDMHSSAKARFLEVFREQILKPRELDNRMQLTGTTGTNAVEAAMKLGRKLKGHADISYVSAGFTV